MPFGQKADATGFVIDFDAVYERLIVPAVQDAGMQALRADEEQIGGIIHKPLFERLILCEFAVADLTTANANVFYELGVRHGVRPYSTVLISAQGSRLPFDVAPVRAILYPVSDEGAPKNVEPIKIAVTKRLTEARNAAVDSPLFQLIEGLKPLDVSHMKTDVFRERVQYSAQMKEKLAAARKQSIEAVRAVQHELGQISNVEAGVVVDLFLSYRAVSAWQDMISLVAEMSPPLAAAVMIQEQFALALNRAGDGDRAERILVQLLGDRGPSSETLGILGRVYKDRWEAALKQGNKLLSQGLLGKAIESYRKGFEADWRDAYPGINAVTLMELQEPPDPQRLELLPVVRYSVERKIAQGKPDYWDYATRLELAVIANDRDAATKALGDSLACVREAWEPETTARNIRLIVEARERRKDLQPWIAEIKEALDQRASRKEQGSEPS
jgi:hypothetical protein